MRESRLVAGFYGQIVKVIWHTFRCEQKCAYLDWESKKNAEPRRGDQDGEGWTPYRAIGVVFNSVIASHAQLSEYLNGVALHMQKEFEMTKLLGKRFAELEDQLATIEASKKMEAHPLGGSSVMEVDSNLLLNWKVKANELMRKACGDSSPHMIAFLGASETGLYGTDYGSLKRMRAVFLAAKEDFEGGYLNSIRNLVQAEVFGSELEQADELLSAGYASAAAVIAGVVLETTIRNLCTEHQIDHGKLDKMNADLAKAGAYNALQQKRITAIAAIRNAAAHGDAGKFNSGDVRGMIDDVERFLATHLQ